MDIKTLFHNLREEVSCPVCTNIYTDPKQLPCLHSFCLHCLNQWHRTSHGRDTIRCPKCQALSRVPESGDLKDLPTSFYLNGLIDVLAIRECKTSQVKCGNCDKSSSENSYCFQCCMFYCQDCIIGHNIMKTYKDHRVLALKEFQDKDYEDVMKRPDFCPTEDHNKEELKYFCKTCEMPVCQICVILDHGGHNMKLIKEEAEIQKSEMKSLVEKQRRNLQAKMNTVNQLDEEFARLMQQGEDVNRDVQRLVDNLVAVIEAKKQNILSSLEKETRRSLDLVMEQKTEIQRQITAIESALENTDKLLTRSSNAEIVQLKKSLDTIFEGIAQTQAIDRDTRSLPAGFVFEENPKLLETVKTDYIGTFQILQLTKASHVICEGKGIEEGMVNREAQFTLTSRNGRGKQYYNERDRVTVEIRDERGRECATEVGINDGGDGLYQIKYTPKDEGRCKVSVKVNGEHIHRSPFTVLVKPFQFKAVLSFGGKGSALKMFIHPFGLAGNTRDEIAVTEFYNNRIQIFNSDGNFIRSLSSKALDLQVPKGIVFRNSGHIFVGDNSGRILIIDGRGECVGSFGGLGSLDDKLNDPWGLSVDSDGNVIVADKGSSLIKIFSPDGKFLMKIGGQGTLKSPVHCIQYDKYLIVSDNGEHCIKVFDRNGNFQYMFGKKGEGEGEFNSPSCMAVNKSGHLMVCDECNHRVQIFELNGKFIGKFGTNGSNLGEFKNPESLVILGNNRIAVSDFHNHRIQLFE